MPIPQQQKNKYNERMSGVFGEFGAGERRRVRYIQGNLRPDDLDSVMMVSDIPGNERWSIRELFQREVDDERVENGIIPYLKDDSKVKFFNPLTFVLLGKDGGGQIDALMHQIAEKPFSVGGAQHDEGWRKYYEINDTFRLKHTGDGYAELEWNTKKAAVVAIDGQHRLSALKRIQSSEYAAKISQWKIPVVILLISPDGKNGRMPIIDSVRKLFLYINKEAHKPNETRQIILDEERVNEMCVQEMLENGRNSDGIPLIAYDWRGAEENMRPVTNSLRDGHTLFSAISMRDYLSEYIMGENFDPYQANMLGINPTEQSLYSLFGDGGEKPSEKHAEDIRKRFCARVLPGISHFVREFSPYKDYIGVIHGIENNANEEIARLALDQIRFGGTAINRFDDWKQGKIKTKMGDIKKEIKAHKDKMPHLLVKREIGGFAVFYAFGTLFEQMGYSDFLKYAQSVTGAFNKAWEVGGKKGLKGILSLNDDDNPGMLHHIIYDHSQRIMNNRLNNVQKGLGALIALAVISHWDITTEQKTKIAKTHLEQLKKTLERGHKREVRDKLHPAERVEADIESEATRIANKQIRQIQNAYGFGDLGPIGENLDIGENSDGD